MFKTRKKEIQKRLGPDGCEEPPDQSGSSKENPRNYNDQSNQQVCLPEFQNSAHGHNQCYNSFFNLRGYRGVQCECSENLFDSNLIPPIVN